ncbi:jg5713 [Pararge aegeria aegeria]|uniref:Jg5713 protein n=1 Tax=Pararge aegeria aegeria TaxID=348720 RepID=A0A8S4SLN7_9NEOP|nr:jg5713 [Pararge aegeria aegeria]
MVRDSQTETEVCLLRAPSAVSVASGATDRSGNTDNCVEEYVCDVPFAGDIIEPTARHDIIKPTAWAGDKYIRGERI